MGRLQGIRAAEEFEAGQGFKLAMGHGWQPEQGDQGYPRIAEPTHGDEIPHEAPMFKRKFAKPPGPGGDWKKLKKKGPK